MGKKQDLTARNIPTARENAKTVVEPSRDVGRASACWPAFTDSKLLLREELRPLLAAQTQRDRQ